MYHSVITFNTFLALILYIKCYFGRQDLLFSSFFRPELIDFPSKDLFIYFYYHSLKDLCQQCFENGKNFLNNYAIDFEQLTNDTRMQGFGIPVLLLPVFTWKILKIEGNARQSLPGGSEHAMYNCTKLLLLYILSIFHGLSFLRIWASTLKKGG